MTGQQANDWLQTACILCHTNCGVEVRLGGDDGRRIVRVKGDKAHPAAKGVALNELTALEDRDAFAGTPWHKYVAARLEPVAAAE